MKSCPAYDRFDGDLEKYYNDIERDIENVSSQLKILNSFIIPLM